MSYEEIKTHLYTAINQVGDLEAERLRLEQAGAALIAENVKLREQVIALTPPLTVAEWLASRGFFVDGDQSKLSLSPDNRYVHVRPGALRAEVGPRHPTLAMIGRLPLSTTVVLHKFGGFVAGWVTHSSKVVGWQAWHTSNQNPSLSLEFVGDRQRIVHSFNGARLVLVDAPLFDRSGWEIRVGGWSPGKRTVEVWLGSARQYAGTLELLPAGSTQGPVVKTGAYFPAWRDGARLAEGNVVVVPADWEAVQA